jgi:hypothetical protein
MIKTADAIRYSMKNYPALVLVLLCLGIVLTAGCTGQKETAQPPLVTETTVLTPAATAVTPPPLTLLTPVETATVVPATSPAADPTDIHAITFLQYSDSDFGIDYPSTWTITSSTYTPDYCPAAFGSGKVECYADAVRSYGPFDFYGDENTFADTARIVVFTSPDGRLKFAAFTRDFRDYQSGNFKIDPNIDWIKNEFQKMYPDLFPTNYVGNYQYFRSGNAMAATYDARLPAGYYPSAYSKKVVVTVHHLYSFAFISDTEGADTYRDLNQRMMSSIETMDIA